MKTSVFFAGVISIMTVACGKQKELRPNEYINWIEDENNGLLRKKNISGFEFTLQYKPHDYLLLKEEGNINLDTELKKEKERLGNMQYYTLKIKSPDGADPLKYKIKQKEDYYGRLKYYSFDVQNDLHLVEGNDTIACSILHFERDYGIRPYLTILLAFPEKFNTKNEKQIIFNEHVFNSGTINFTIDPEDLNNIPTLKL